MSNRAKAVSLIILILAFLMLIGASYAFYSGNFYKNEKGQTIDVNSKYIAVEYNDGDAIMHFDGDYIFPGDSATKEFEVENIGNVEINYSIFIEDVINEFSRTQDLRYKLYINDEEVKEAAINENKVQYLYFDKSLLVGQTDKVKFVFTYATTDEIQNEDKNKSISFKFNIDTKEKQIEEAPDGIVHISNNPSINNYRIYGNSVQNGTPATDVPVQIQSVGDLNLPFEYQEVEYIESTGTQYIDTGIIPNQNTGFDITFLSNNKISSSSAEYGCILGSRKSSQVNELQLTSFIPADSGYQGSLSFGTSLTVNAGISVGEKNSVSLRNQFYSNGNNVQHNFDTTFASPVNLYVFALNNGGKAAQHGKLKLYNLKLYKGNTLIRDFIPCYRKSDGVIGLYDLVYNQFYTNSGTGDFKKGVNIDGEDIGYKIPIKVIGKNLFNLNEVSLLNNWNKISIRNYYDLNFKNNTEYTFSYDLLNDEYINGEKGNINNSANISRKNGTNLSLIKPIISNNMNINIPLLDEIITFTANTTECLTVYSPNYLNQAELNLLLDGLDEFQIEVGSEKTDYEEYKEINTIIKLDEPLRKIGDYVDYIDFENQVVVRNVEVVDDTGTLPIEESLRGLDTPIIEPIKLPLILIHENVNNIYINTNIVPSATLVEYYNN